MEPCGGCNHSMHNDQCTHVETIPRDGGGESYERCECPEGMTPQVFQGRMLIQISRQIQELIEVETTNQQLMRLIVQGMARASEKRIITH